MTVHTSFPAADTHVHLRELMEKLLTKTEEIQARPIDYKPTKLDLMLAYQDLSTVVMEMRRINSNQQSLELHMHLNDDKNVPL